jgi:hypothetical protein
MINAENLFESMAKLKFWKWQSPNNGKWVVFEALPEVEAPPGSDERASRRTTSFELEADADTYLKARRDKFVEFLLETIECRPISASGRDTLKGSSGSTTKSLSKKTKQSQGKSSKQGSRLSTDKTITPPSSESETSPPF